jgi:23S rRNA (uracil1939-C5)-methyltransferase
MTTPPAEPEELEITGLGAQGDGIAETETGTRYVAFALPGERVVVEGNGPPRLVSAPSPDRVAPPCRHFGVCGGCVAQHMGDRLYAEWKRDIVVTAFEQRGLKPHIAPLRRVAPGTRRRAVLTARRANGRIVLGYHRRRSPELVDIEECPVLLPGTVRKLAALRAVAAALPAPEVRLTVLDAPAGLDIAAETGGLQPRHGGARKGQRPARGPAHGPTQGPAQGPGRGAIAELGRIAIQHGLARVAVDGETVIERTRPALAMGEVEVALPPAAFVQAVLASEAAMRNLVVAALASPKRVADLFCGVGTFTFGLARHARVLAVDSDERAIAALGAAARHARGLKPIEARVRDLFREPLSTRELEPFDTVLLDPPRAGASRQAQELARSQVGTVVAVSCDPGTLARDAQSLTQGGYVVESVTPIDQFVLSAHVEAVAVLRRPAPASTRRR